MVATESEVCEARRVWRAKDVVSWSDESRRATKVLLLETVHIHLVLRCNRLGSETETHFKTGS